MKVNPSQETAFSLLDSAISREKLQTSFAATLDVAQQQHGKRQSKAPEPAAMDDALAIALKELQDYIEKGPIAHMREAILKEMGLTEEDVAAMSPEQRAAIEDTIADKIKEKLLAGSGAEAKRVQSQLTGLPLPIVAAAENEPR